MSKDKRNSKQDRQRLLDYVSDKLSEQERNTLEKELQKDAFAAEALDGYSSVSREGAARDLEELDKRLHRRLTIRKRIIKYRIAAAVAALLAASAALLTVYHEELGILEPVALKEPSRQTEQPGIQKEAPGPATVPEIDDPAEPGAGPAAGPEKSEPVAAPVAVPEAGAADRESSLADLSGGTTASGTVRSAEGQQPVAGALVSVKGTEITTQTDTSGQFEIQVPEEKNVSLVTEFIGMEEKEIPVSEQQSVEIIMEPDAGVLDEMLIEGTKARKKVSAARSGGVRHETQPSPSGYEAAAPVSGNEEFKEYIRKNLEFPSGTDLTRAIVVLGFVVSEEGKPTRIKVLQTPGNRFSEEAKRLLTQGPRWNPASQDGQYLEEETRLRMVLEKPD